jgi:hypothetical protein
MSDRPTRRFWQIHLSTAVVLMLLTSLLLGANLQCRTQTYTIDGAGALIPFQFSQWGWPMPWPDNPWARGQRYFISPDIDYYAPMFINIVVGSTIVFLVATINEIRIRRREAHNS